MVWVVRMMGIGFKGAIGLSDSRLTVFYRYCSARLGLVVRSTTSANPVVVEDLLHVAAAGIGHQHHDELVFVEVVLAGVFQRGEHGHAG